MSPRSSPFRYNRLRGEYRLIAKDAVEFAAVKFCPRMWKYMTIRVVGNSNMLDKDHHYGFCEYQWDDPYDRIFRIEICCTLKPYDFLETLMHEMVHVKQFAKREMSDYAFSPDLVRWHRDKINIEKVDYFELPWEKEAHALERPLAQEFLDVHPEWRNYIMKEKENELCTQNMS